MIKNISKNMNVMTTNSILAMLIVCITAVMSSSSKDDKVK